MVLTTLSDVFSNFGDVCSLDFPEWDVNVVQTILKAHPGWAQYNPRKPHIKRFGLSVTSLDGGFSGIPDLDSLREYNLLNSTTYNERSFTQLTSIYKVIPAVLDARVDFPDSLGRCHFLRLDAGGFFPPHRDNGLTLPSQTFRILVPLVDFTSTGKFVWLQEGQPLHLKAGTSYLINTTKVHSLFSFEDWCLMYVMNIIANEVSIKKVVSHLKVL